MDEAVHLLCSRCGTVNRVPAARLVDRPVCGSCHGPLFTGTPLELDETGLQRQLLHDELPLLVDFWAPWCDPCQMMAPEFAAAAGTLEPHVRLVKLNTDRAQTMAARFGIRSIPTLVLFERGRERARQSGALGAAQIVRWTREHLAGT